MKNTLTITLLQTRLFWEDKAANLRMLQKKIESIDSKTEIVLLPEMFSTGFSMNAEQLAETMDGPTMQWIKQLSVKTKTVLAGSVIIKDIDDDGDERYYNRLIWMLPNGEYGVYDKHHLFTLVEENETYTAGEKRLIASVNDWKIHLQICYDLRFPVWSRQIPQVPGERWRGLYDVLVYVANWPEARSNAWKILLQARAIENQCYVVGVNRVGDDGKGVPHSGDSMVIDPLGEVLYHKKDEEDIFTITLQKDHLNTIREKFPFWKDGDEFRIY